MSHRVLIVDDEQGIRQALKQVLEYEDLEVRVAASGGEAISLYTEFRPHLVFLDVKMAGLDGLETLTRLRDLDPGPQIVMISGHGTIATAVVANSVEYDNLTRVHTLVRVVDGKVDTQQRTDNEAVVQQLMTSFQRLPLFRTSVLEPNREYYVRISATARPSNGAFLWPWGSGTSGQAKFTFVR